jgi:hypothetical protein
MVVVAVGLEVVAVTVALAAEVLEIFLVGMEIHHLPHHPKETMGAQDLLRSLQPLDKAEAVEQVQ